MRVIAILIASLSAAAAFAPQSVNSRTSTELNALFDNIAGMDLFNKENSLYGARNKKQLKQGQIGSKSYVPSGLTAEQYKKVRAKDQKKKDDTYANNVKKAFKWKGFDEFYEKRGTEEGGSWLRAPGRGHTFAKLKYDIESKNVKKPEAFSGSIFGKKK